MFIKIMIIISILISTNIGIASAASSSACKSNRDCSVVFESWCKTPIALNQSSMISWLYKDHTNYSKAKKNRQTCKEHDADAIFYARCENKQCVLKHVE